MSNQPPSDVDEACSHLRDVLLETRGQDRREFLRALGRAAAGSALLAPFAALSASADTKPMTYFTYGGAWKKAIMAAFGDPFTKKTGIPVRYQEPYNFGKLVAMHQAHAQQIDARDDFGRRGHHRAAIRHAHAARLEPDRQIGAVGCSAAAT